MLFIILSILIINAFALRSIYYFSKQKNHIDKKHQLRNEPKKKLKESNDEFYKLALMLTESTGRSVLRNIKNIGDEERGEWRGRYDVQRSIKQTLEID